MPLFPLRSITAEAFVIYNSKKVMYLLPKFDIIGSLHVGRINNMEIIPVSLSETS
jgi:hypothetical protein